MKPDRGKHGHLRGLRGLSPNRLSVFRRAWGGGVVERGGAGTLATGGAFDSDLALEVDCGSGIASFPSEVPTLELLTALAAPFAG